MRQRLESTKKALQTLEEVLQISAPSTIERDASIQRFEYCFEAQWKLAKQYLRDIEGLEVGSPKGVARSCREVGILNEEETTQALEMVNDRNMTTHTYDETIAEDIYRRIPSYSKLMNTWYRRIVKRTKTS